MNCVVLVRSEAFYLVLMSGTSHDWDEFPGSVLTAINICALDHIIESVVDCVSGDVAIGTLRTVPCHSDGH